MKAFRTLNGRGLRPASHYEKFAVINALEMCPGEPPQWVKSEANDKANTLLRRHLRNSKVVVRDYRFDWKADPIIGCGPRDFIGRTGLPRALRAAYTASNYVVVDDIIRAPGRAALQSELSCIAYRHLYPVEDTAPSAVAAAAGSRFDAALGGAEQLYAGT